jgi:hypothetical protein
MILLSIPTQDDDLEQSYDQQQQVKLPPTTWPNLAENADDNFDYDEEEDEDEEDKFLDPKTALGQVSRSHTYHAYQ